MRLSISTKLPDSGRSDQRVSPVTWKSTIKPLPRRAAVTSGVPSASVGEDEHRQVLVEKMRHRFRRRLALREPHIGERAERAPDVVARGQQRLRRIGGRAGDDADGAAAPALVEELDRAGRALAGNLDA